MNEARPSGILAATRCRGEWLILRPLVIRMQETHYKGAQVTVWVVEVRHLS